MIDLGPPPQLYIPARPALVRAHQGDLDALARLEREQGIRAFLPGAAPIVAAVGGATSALILFASSSSTGTTVTMPTGVADEDLAVLVDRGYGFSGVPTAVTPSGFTSRANVAAPSSQRVMVTTKLLLAADGGATVTGMASDNSRKRLLVFRHVDGIVSVAASAVTSTYSDSTDPAAASATYTGLSGSSITLGILAAGFTSTPASPSFSPAETGVLAAGELRVYYLLTPTGDPGSVSVDQGNSGARNQNILLNLEVS